MIHVENDAPLEQERVEPLIEEEPLQEPDEPILPIGEVPEPPTPDRSINQIIPTLIANVLFAPSKETGDGKPLTPEQLGKQYVAFTAPVLDMIEFHKCLGAVGELSQTTRLVIGIGVLAGGLIFLRPPKQQRKKEKSEAHTDSSQQP